MTFLKYIFKRIHESLRNFANDGTVHGFHEIYASKTFVFKIFWSVVLVASFGTAFFQIDVVSRRFLGEENVATAISVLSTDSAGNQIYPPVAVCYCHWTTWVNYSRVLKYGLDKQTFLYSMSFISDVVANQSIDVAKARMAFLKVMAENNFSTITCYYQAIARDTPISIKGRNLKLPTDDTDDEPITSRLTLRNVGMREFQLCHEYSTETMKRLIEPQANKIIEFSIKPTTYQMIDQNMVTDSEYNFYAARFLRENTFFWILDDSHLLDFTKFTLPFLFLSNAYDGRHFETMNNVLELNYFMMTATVHRTNSKITGCVENAKIIERNRTCDKKCNAAYPPFKRSGCVDVTDLAVVGQDLVEYACRRKIVTLERISTNHEFSYDSPDAQVPDIDNGQEEIRRKCLSRCKSYRPCESWRYKYTLDKATVPEYSDRMLVDRNFEVYLKYQSTSDILVIEKIRRKNWYLYIGNVGGIFGIWTGASMITFVQIIYFCTVHESPEQNNEPESETNDR